jgi:hypothetical protein
VRNSDSEKRLSLLTLGLEKDLSTPSSSSRLSMVAALAEPIPQVGAAHQISGDLGFF